MDELIIIGAGDHARVALETARACAFAVRAFIEPARDRQTSPRIAGIPVLDELAAVDDGDVAFIVSIGENRARAALFDRAVAAGGTPATLIHPTAIVLRGATIGAGSHICAAAVIGLDVRVADDVIVNTAAILDHDVVIGDHAFVGPGARLAGRVFVDRGAHIGIGSTVIERRRIGSWSLIAAGAVVVSEVTPGARVAGVPARAMHAQGGNSQE